MAKVCVQACLPRIPHPIPTSTKPTRAAKQVYSTFATLFFGGLGCRPSSSLRYFCLWDPRMPLSSPWLGSSVACCSFTMSIAWKSFYIYSEDA